MYDDLLINLYCICSGGVSGDGDGGGVLGSDCQSPLAALNVLTSAVSQSCPPDTSLSIQFDNDIDSLDKLLPPKSGSCTESFPSQLSISTAVSSSNVNKSSTVNNTSNDIQSRSFTKSHLEDNGNHINNVNSDNFNNFTSNQDESDSILQNPLDTAKSKNKRSRGKFFLSSIIVCLLIKMKLCLILLRLGFR